MKLFVILFAFLCLKTFAYDTCTVKAPRDRELQTGINKDTICDEVFYALKRERNTIADKLKLRVTARSTFSVSLNIKYVTEEGTNGTEKGVLHWYPGDSYVRLVD
jgi:hypothetical protein